MANAWIRLLLNVECLNTIHNLAVSYVRFYLKWTWVDDMQSVGFRRTKCELAKGIITSCGCGQFLLETSVVSLTHYSRYSIGMNDSLMKWTGNEATKIKLYYCPIFASCKVVLHFCLANHIYFEPHTIDFMRGDFKEHPILVDHELNFTDWYSFHSFISTLMLTIHQHINH